MAQCAFCPIVAGTADAHVVVDEPRVMAFLDVRPLFPGHTLVVPRQHHETLADLPPDLLVPLFGVVRVLSAVVEASLGAAGSFVAVNNRVSQSVPHLHVHVVPRRKKDGQISRTFAWTRRPYENDVAMRASAEAIRAAVAPSP